MKNKIQRFVPAFSLFLLLGCGSSNVKHRSMTKDVRTATDVPERFESPAGTSMGSIACLSPLTDPRDGTKIIMQTSFGKEGVGDYVVPGGKYGVENGELLRINCATGEVVGIVKK